MSLSLDWLGISVVKSIQGMYTSILLKPIWMVHTVSKSLKVSDIEPASDNNPNRFRTVQILKIQSNSNHILKT